MNSTLKYNLHSWGLQFEILWRIWAVLIKFFCHFSAFKTIGYLQILDWQIYWRTCTQERWLVAAAAECWQWKSDLRLARLKNLSKCIEKKRGFHLKGFNQSLNYQMSGWQKRGNYKYIRYIHNVVFIFKIALSIIPFSSFILKFI